jgi:hypothetical protein
LRLRWSRRLGHLTRRSIIALVLLFAAPSAACAQEPSAPLGERIDVQGPAGVLRGSLLTPESGAGTNLAAYGNANVPLAPGIAERIAAFVTEQGVPE